MVIDKLNMKIVKIMQINFSYKYFNTAQTVTYFHNTAQTVTYFHNTAQTVTYFHNTTQTVTYFHDTTQTVTYFHNTTQTVTYFHILMQAYLLDVYDKHCKIFSWIGLALTSSGPLGSVK